MHTECAIDQGMVSLCAAVRQSDGYTLGTGSFYPRRRLQRWLIRKKDLPVSEAGRS